MQHALERTSAKGEAFVGRCINCGKAGLTAADARKECANDVGRTQEATVLAALEAAPQCAKCGRDAEFCRWDSEYGDGPGACLLLELQKTLDALTAENAQLKARLRELDPEPDRCPVMLPNQFGKERCGRERDHAGKCCYARMD